MKTFTENSTNKEKESVSNNQSKTQKGSNSNTQFVDNRPEALAQRKMQELLRNGTGTEQLNSTVESDSVDNKVNTQQDKTLASKNSNLPENLNSGIENLSGMALDDVNVHRNSNKPAELNALAYAQGTDIHLGPGQEKYLPHEAWHIVQQRQGRVRPTTQMMGKSNGMALNDDAYLEQEADLMGGKAMQMKTAENNGLAPANGTLNKGISALSSGKVVQRVVDPAAEYSYEEYPESDPYAESSLEEESPVSDPYAESSLEEESPVSDPYAESSLEEESLVSDPYAESSLEEESPVSDPYAESSLEEESPVSDPYAESSMEEEGLVQDESPVSENEAQHHEIGELGTIPEYLSKLGYLIDAAAPAVGTGVEISASGAVAAEGVYVAMDAKVSIERDENGLKGSLEITTKVGLGVIAAGADTHGAITLGDNLEIKADDGVEFMNLGGLHMYNYFAKTPDSIWEAVTSPTLYAIRESGMGEIIANCLWGKGFPEYVKKNMDPLTLNGVENEEADSISRTLTAGGEIAAEAGDGDTEAGIEVAMGGSMKETTGVDESGADAAEYETNFSASTKIKVGEVEAEVKADAVEGLECTLQIPYPKAAKGPAQAVLNSFNNVISDVINNIISKDSKDPLSLQNALSIISNWQSPILAALSEHDILDNSLEFKVNVHPTKGVEIVVTLIYGADESSPKSTGVKGEVKVEQKTQILKLP